MQRDTEIEVESAKELAVLPLGQIQSHTNGSTTRSFLPAWLTKTFLVIAGLSLFILALRMLTKGASAVGPLMIKALHIHGAANTLGFGWLFASLVLSGAPVASVALSFLASHVLTPVQTFTMITGSRLGADMIVFFIGFIYFLRGHPKSTSISLGVIAQSVTATTYLPALPFGYWLLTSHVMDNTRIALPKSITGLVEVVFDPIVKLVAMHLNPWLVFFLGVGAVLVAFRILDRALPHLDANQRSFGRVGRLVYRPFAMFALGAVITLIGMSVSVSISLLVPLSARGIIRRENTVPYILGSNLATLIDKLLPAVLVGHPLAVPIILIEMATISTISLSIMLFFYRPYERLILGILDRVLASNMALALFMALMVGVPLVLVLI